MIYQVTIEFIVEAETITEANNDVRLIIEDGIHDHSAGTGVRAWTLSKSKDLE